MDPISSNGQAQSTATVQDQRSAKVEATPTFQTPDRQPLVAPPMPVTGGSQIAAVVRGMISGEIDPAEKQKTEEDKDKEPDRILKPYGMDMLPEIKREEIAPPIQEDDEPETEPRTSPEDDRAPKEQPDRNPLTAERQPSAETSATPREVATARSQETQPDKE